MKSSSPIFLAKNEKTKCFKTPPRHPKFDLKSDPEPTKKIFGVNDMEKCFTPNPGGIYFGGQHKRFIFPYKSYPSKHTQKNVLAPTRKSKTSADGRFILDPQCLLKVRRCKFLDEKQNFQYF